VSLPLVSLCLGGECFSFFDQRRPTTARELALPSAVRRLPSYVYRLTSYVLRLTPDTSRLTPHARHPAPATSLTF
jgi:hypothetical protein